jgi:chemotaxis protein MotB
MYLASGRSPPAAASAKADLAERMRNMRMLRMMVMGLIAAASMTMTGCNNSLKTENANLTSENQSLRDQLADRNKALEDCNGELRSREQQLAEMRRGGSTTGGTAFDGIAGVTGSYNAGEVTAAVEGDLLFDSGKTSLKSAAKKSLDAVAAVLNSTYGGANIRIAGHTDSDPIRKSGFKTNYHLGFERAWAVREYLISKGISAKRLSLASHGPDMPKSSKPQSRRVEIVVIVGGGAMASATTGQ